MVTERERAIFIMRCPKGRTLNETEEWEGCRYEAIGNGWSMRLSARMVPPALDRKNAPAATARAWRGIP
jgi:hypothetical protein